VVADQTAASGPTGRLFRVDPTTGTQTVLSTGQHFVDPAGVAVEANGDILVIDRNVPITDGWASAPARAP
jgi:sugar lactone lactonase YvrE